MALQIIDYSKIAPQGAPYKDLFESVLKGYKMEQEPAKMKQEATQRDLANKLKDLEVEHKPKEYELNDKQKELTNALSFKALKNYDEKYNLEKKYKQSQINKNNRVPAGTSAALKANGAVQNANVIWNLEHPEGDTTPELKEEHIKSLKNAFARNQEHEQTIINRSKDVVAGNSFDKLPTNDKKQSVALMKGMGVDPVEAVSYLRQSGNSPSTYAQEKGIDIHQVVPDYSAGEQNIKMAQQAAAYQQELKPLEKHIMEGLGEYQGKLMGYSMKQIAEAAEGKNTPKQARALAARALLPELNALRLKIMGGNIGIEALKELEHKSLGELKIIDGLVDKKTFKEAQRLMGEWIDEAGSVRTKALIGNSMLKTGQQKSAENESRAGKVYDLSTGRWEDQ